MERARHRKSKSASGIEGIQPGQKHKSISRLSSDARSYIDGSSKDSMVMFELAQSSVGRGTGIPMKKLLAEEMSKEVEHKRRSPSVIARLMGLEGLPSPRPVNRQQKKFLDNHHQQKDFSTDIQQSRQLYDGHSNRRNTMEEQEFKDVYEDLEASHVANRRCSSRWGASSILTKAEMALIRQKLIDAKRLSTDEKLQDSKELDDTLEMLDSNKDVLLKFLRQPDSLFAKHLHHEQFGPENSRGSHIAVLKPLNSEKYESKAKAWRPERDTLSKHHSSSHLKREDGLLLERHSRHRSHVSRNTSRVQREEKNEENILPTRIVVLKPNLAKMQNSGASSSSPDLSHGYQASFKKIKGCPSFADDETASCRRKDSSHNVRLPKPMSQEAKEIAREITMRMRDGCDENIDATFTVFRGYIGDESSNDAQESDSESESEVFKLFSRKSFDDNKFSRYSSSRFGESSVNREAKKRLSERWKMTQNYQDLEMVSRGSTLGEMLALPERETRSNHLNARSSVRRASNQPGSSNGTAMWDGPLGISSRDGWKDDISRNSSRSKSLPPCTGGRERSHRRSRYHDELAEDKIRIHNDAGSRGRSKVVKGNLNHKEDYPSKDTKSHSKRPQTYTCKFTDEMNSLPEANFEIQMEANTKDLSVQQSIFKMAAKGASELLSKQSSSVIDDEKSAAGEQEDFNIKELHTEPKQCSPSTSLRCLGAEPNSSESSKEADHPSPISVLEVPFTEDTSSAESFERVSAELQELRMQLKLLKMETCPYAESSTLVPIEEEEAQLSPMSSEANYSLGDESWEVSYAVDVLIDSGLEESDFNMFRTKWHSPDTPLDPKLFDKLEKKYSEDTTGISRPERKLLFDRINSSLLEILEKHIDLCPWVMPKLAGVDSEWEKARVRDAFEKLIDEDLDNGEMSERVLDRDMQWSDYRGEIAVIGNEIEKLLIDDMIIEVLCN